MVDQDCSRIEEDSRQGIHLTAVPFTKVVDDEGECWREEEKEVGGEDGPSEQSLAAQRGREGVTGVTTS